MLLGDLRVLLLTIGVARPERTWRQNLGWAGGTTLVVRVATGLIYGALNFLIDDLHSQALWMIYESGFLVLCVTLSRQWLPRTLEGDPLADAKTTYLRSIFGYSAAYYALWLIADVFIAVADLDLGWAIRMVPNQLYYAFWVPFAYRGFFSVEAGVSGNAAR